MVFSLTSLGANIPRLSMIESINTGDCEGNEAEYGTDISMSGYIIAEI